MDPIKYATELQKATWRKNDAEFKLAQAETWSKEDSTVDLPAARRDYAEAVRQLKKFTTRTN